MPFCIMKTIINLDKWGRVKRVFRFNILFKIEMKTERIVSNDDKENSIVLNRIC
jgi:hypothetical protein